MPRIRCPGCKGVLRIDESILGRAVRCPKCQRRFTAPSAEEDDEPVEMEVVERPKKPAAYGLSDEPDAPRPMPRYDRDDEEDEDRRPIRRRRRRGHGPQATGLMGFLTAEWNLD